MRAAIGAYLTPTERDVAYLYMDGWTRAQIAKRLGKTRRAVSWHIENLYAKASILAGDYQDYPEQRREALEQAISEWFSHRTIA